MLLFTTVIVVAYGIFIQWIWGWGQIVSLWLHAGLLPVSVAMLLLLSTYFLRTWRIYDYFPAETHGRFGPLFRLVQIHNLLNVMLPFRTGETSFPLLMKKEFGLSLARGTAALFVMRLFDLHALLAAAGAGLALDYHHPLAWGMWIIFLLLPVAGFIARDLVFRLAAKILPARLQPLLRELQRGLPSSLPAFARAWGATVINWFVKIAVLAWVLMLMGELNIAGGFGGALGGELSSVLPIHAPAGVGTYPGGITAGAVAFGASSHKHALEALGQAAVNVHLMVIVSSLIGTALSLFVRRKA
jgi:hypothetical protein